MCRKLLSRDHKITLSSSSFLSYSSSRLYLLWGGNAILKEGEVRGEATGSGLASCRIL
jgi:hypothetical protein